MKRTIAVLILALSLFQAVGFAAENPVMSMRRRFLNNSGTIKPLLQNSSDVVLLTTMWDSCFIVMTQLDAYASMIGIVDTVKKEDLREGAVDFLLKWINEVQNTNNAAIAALGLPEKNLEPKTAAVVKKMKVDLIELNKVLDTETTRLMRLKEGIIKRVFSPKA